MYISHIIKQYSYLTDDSPPVSLNFYIGDSRNNLNEKVNFLIHVQS